MTRRLGLLVVAVTLATIAAAIGGCGGSDDSATGAGKEIAGKTEPEVSVPDGPPPDEVVIEDIEEGAGRTVTPDSVVTVLYVGVNWRGSSYSNAWTYRTPPVFNLGEKELMVGLARGIQGMRVGGRRQVIVPTDLQYSSRQPSLATKSSRDTLVFVVDLLAARR